MTSAIPTQDRTQTNPTQLSLIANFLVILLAPLAKAQHNPAIGAITKGAIADYQGSVAGGGAIAFNSADFNKVVTLLVSWQSVA